MSYPTDRRYTREHEWIQVNGNSANIGITDYAQKQLGDVVFVELPDAGRAVAQGQAVALIQHSHFFVAEIIQHQPRADVEGRLI